MTKSEQKDIIDDLIGQINEIRDKKASDYASDGDVLSNFKLTAMLEGRSTYETVLHFINTKVVRLNNLAQKDQVLNESVEDSLMDMVNYALLAVCVLKERK